MKALIAIVLIGSSFALMAEDMQCPVEPVCMEMHDQEIASFYVYGDPNPIAPTIKEVFKFTCEGDIYVTAWSNSDPQYTYYAEHILRVNFK